MDYEQMMQASSVYFSTKNVKLSIVCFRMFVNCVWGFWEHLENQVGDEAGEKGMKVSFESHKTHNLANLQRNILCSFSA